MEISRLWVVRWILLVTRIMMIRNSEIWPLERPDGMPTIQSLEVMCGKDHMDVHLQFSQPFEGIVSSKGQYGDPRCVYVPPSSGKSYFTFRIAYARCGTKPDLNGQFYENTVVVQYDKDLLEVWDEAKRLRCEWYNDYEKTASKPPMVIADLDVVQLDFRGDNVDCWMEIQHGKGPWAPPVSGIVPLGSTLTLVVAINDYRGEFDMRVKSCAASDGGQHIIQLSDEHGCVLRPKMISRFLKARITDERASVITYAFFHAFKFPDALSVHIKCKVEICRHGCLDHCQQANVDSSVASHLQSTFDDYNTLERKDTSEEDDRKTGGESADSSLGKDAVRPQHQTVPKLESVPQKLSDPFRDLIYDDRTSIENIDDGEILSTDEAAAYPLMSNNAAGAEKPIEMPNIKIDTVKKPIHDESATVSSFTQAVIHNTHREGHERFPHGPRKLKDDIDIASDGRKTPNSSGIGISTQKRRRRSFVISDKKASNANVGVSGLYEVVSEADLAFTPDNKEEAVAVLQGKIGQEVVYGVCLPVPGFSAVFMLMVASVIASALIAGFLMYRYQVQRETQRMMAVQHQRRHQQLLHGNAAELAVNSLASWMAFRLSKTRPPAQKHGGPPVVNTAGANHHNS